MATRTVFHHTNVTTEQKLHEDLIIEAIQIYGQDVYYLPRTNAVIDTFFGEDAGSTLYDTAIPVEMYVKDVEAFEGEGSFMQQFGLEIKDQTTFTIARKVFTDLNTGLNQPKEGDLVWFPLINAMFKIQFVEDQSIFYQLGHLPVFDLQCELFDFQHEVFRTGIAEIDEYGRKIAEDSTYDLEVGGVGSFEVGENVFQGTLNDPTFNAVVKDFDPLGPSITLFSSTGLPGAVTLTGEDSGAAWVVDLPIDTTQIEMESSGGDNWIIEEEATTFLDFSEKNPFGDI